MCFFTAAASAMLGCAYMVADPAGMGSTDCSSAPTGQLSLGWKAVSQGGALYPLLARDGDGSIYVAGKRSMGTTIAFDINAAPEPALDSEAVFVAKFDADKNYRWLRTFASTGDVTLNAAVGTRDGGVVLAGDFTGTLSLDGTSVTSVPTADNPPEDLDAFVVAFDASGNKHWLTSFGNENEQTARALAVDNDNDVLVETFSTGGAVNFGCPNPMDTSSSVHVTKLDPSGACVWNRTFALSENTGQFSMSYQPSDDSIWIGGQAGAGLPLGGAEGNGEMAFLAKLTNGSNPPDIVGVTAFGTASGVGNRAITSIAIDPCAGDVFVAGTFDSGIDFGAASYSDAGMFVAKLTPTSTAPSGTLAWHRVMSEAGMQVPTRVVTNGRGDVVLVGRAIADDGATGLDFGAGCAPQSGTAGVPELFLAKYNDGASGPTCVLAYRAHDAAAEAQEAEDAMMDDAGRVLLSASFRDSTFDFFGHSISGGDSWTALVAELAPSP